MADHVVHEEHDSIDKPLADQVIDSYESCLTNGLVISTSFKGIIENKSDSKRKLLQMIFMLSMALSVIPRHALLCFLYSKDEDTRRYWEFYLPNTLEQFGLYGKVTNFGYTVFALMIFIDVCYFRAFESKGRVDYLINVDNLRHSKQNTSRIGADPTQFLGEEEKQKLLKGIVTKLKFQKYSGILLYWSLHSYQLISCPLYIYNERPALLTTILAITNMIIMIFYHYYGTTFFFAIYTSYIITVDYFSSRIEFMMKGLKEEIPLDDKITRLLIQYNKLMTDFRKQDYLLKYVLRNMMYGYCAGLSILFFLFTVDMNLFLRIFMLSGITSLSLVMLTCGLYVGRLHSVTLVMFRELSALTARNTRPIKSYDTFKARRILLNCIKELGNRQTDGQYVFGLRDGHGPAISNLEMFQLTMAIISNTLMVMDFVYH